MNYYNEFDPHAAAWLRGLIDENLIPPGHVDTRSITEISPSDLHGYTQCHFFAGIGGWSLALQIGGWADDRPVWTGSCPCQPFSVAGEGKGIEDERHLWPAFFALIRACNPPLVFGEQVASAAVLGSSAKPSKRSAGKAVQPAWLDGVFADLESAGYACGSSDIPAAGVGAPHIRQRCWWGAVRMADAVRDGQSGPGIVGRSCDSAAGENREEHRTINAGWQRVSFAADCLGGDEDEFGDERSICGLDYTDDCQCPGPTQDGYEYRERDGVLYARRLAYTEGEGPSPGSVGAALTESRTEGEGSGGAADFERERLEGRRCSKRDQQREIRQVESFHISPEENNYWGNSYLHPCRDGKYRRVPVEPGLFPLADGIPYKVARRRTVRPPLLRGAGNAICPEVAAVFVKAFLESI